MSNPIELLTVSQQEIARAALVYPDVEVATMSARKLAEVQEILDDACIALDITGESYAERRKKLLAVLQGKEPAPNGRAHALEREKDTKAQLQGARQYEVDPAPLSPQEIEEYRQIALELPNYLRPVLVLLARGYNAAAMSQRLNLSVNTISEYQSAIGKRFGWQNMHRSVKASLIKAFLALEDEPPEEDPKPEQVQEVPAKTSSETKLKEHFLEQHIARLEVFVESLGGGSLANSITLVLEELARLRK